MTKSSTMTQTRTSVSTETKVLVAVGIVAGLAAAAYGFGFTAGTNLFSPSKPSPSKIVLDCQARCQETFCPKTIKNPRCDLAGVATCQRNCTVTSVSPGSCRFTAQQFPIGQGWILTGGGPWTSYDAYRMTATDEDIVINRVAVYTPTDAANYNRVGVAVNGVLMGQATMAAGRDFTNVDVGSVRIPRGASLVFDIWGQTAPVVSSASVGGATTGAARSGNLLALGIMSGRTDSGWDSSYADRYNMVATCGTSPDRHAYAEHIGTSTYGPMSVLRKTIVYATSTRLSTTTLAAGQQDLAGALMWADPAGSGAWKKLSFGYVISRAPGSTLTFSNFRLRRGATDMAPSSYVVLDQDGNSLSSGSISATTTRGIITVVLTNEEIISGSGQSYTLSATTGGTLASGDQITLTMPTEVLAPSITGYLTSSNRSSALEGMTGPNLDTSQPADGRPELFPAFFVWSDLSEVPHSPAVGTSGGSRDWIAGDLVVRGSPFTLTR